LLLPDKQAFVIDDAHQGNDVVVAEAAEEITGGGGIRDTLSGDSVEIDLVVAEQFKVSKGSAASEEVVGEVEDVVGFVIGEMAFEQGQMGVEGIGEIEAFDQEQASAQTTETASTDLGGEVVVDVEVLEETLTLLLPAAFAEAMCDAAAAGAEALLGAGLVLGLLFLYPGLHLNYLAQQGKTGDRLTTLFSGTAEVFQGYDSCWC
jgi:hypothetical protein